MKASTSGLLNIKGNNKSFSLYAWFLPFFRPLKPLPNNLLLEPHYSKILINKTKAVLTNDFKLLKVIGKGGFSKVYMGNLLALTLSS